MSKITDACNVLREFVKNAGGKEVQLNIWADGRIALLAYREDGSNIMSLSSGSSSVKSPRVQSSATSSGGILRKNGDIDLGPRPEDIIAAWWKTQ
jgi:hypothetical protein